MRISVPRQLVLCSPLLLAACGGSLSYYGKGKPADDAVEPVDSGSTQTTEPTEPVDTADTETTTTDTTTTTTTTTDPGPDCTRRADCDDPRCEDVCDADGDGEISEALGGPDCDDGDDAIHPGAEDVCDQVDNDCDGVRDGDGDRDGFDVCDDCDDTDRTVNPGRADPCDGIDSDCDGADCAPWDEDFEAAGLGANWTKTGAVDWHVGTDWARRGLQSAISGRIDHSQQCSMEITFDMASAGSVSFWHKGDTESGFDKLHFYIDGVQQDIWSGSWVWTQETYPVGVGIHTFEWQYTKDGSVSTGTDQVAIDDLTVEGGRPR
jgi:hypothetical protein